MENEEDDKLITHLEQKATALTKALITGQRLWEETRKERDRYKKELDDMKQALLEGRVTILGTTHAEKDSSSQD